MEHKEFYINRVESDNEDFKIFQKLCDRAKQIIINGLKNAGGYYYLYVFGIDHKLLSFSPIEQIFCIAKDIYDLGGLENDFRVSISAQSFIKAKEKTYRCDFLVETVIFGNEEMVLKKPLIIELDGYDYHSTKEQVSYDYERENQLKLCGYDVMRFTGSQVYKNPMKCIDKVYEYCRKAELEGNNGKI